MTPGISNSPKPAVTLAHLKGKEDKELDCHLAKVEKERVVADAEAFHQNIKGIVEPTSNIGRRYLATKYPGRYPQWSHLVEGKGGVEARATQKGTTLIFQNYDGFHFSYFVTKPQQLNPLGPQEEAQAPMQDPVVEESEERELDLEGDEVVMGQQNMHKEVGQCLGASNTRWICRLAPHS